MSDELREKLAEYAHNAWSGWMEYLFSRGKFDVPTILETGDTPESIKMDYSGATWTMPAWAVERWTRQMDTPYAELPEEEKESDRKEADEMLAIFEEFSPKANGDTSDGYHTFNELYEHRHALFAVLMTAYHRQAWKTWRNQQGVQMNGWFLAGIDTPYGQISYHYPAEWWDRMPWVRVIERNVHYDGHTAQDVLERLHKMAHFDFRRSG